MNGDVCRLAACAGDLDMLQWLRQLQPPCPWPEWRIPIAAAWNAKEGQVQWLLDAGCPWSNKLYRKVQAIPALRCVRFPGVRRSGRRQAA